jgi:hypothetical protein
LAKDRPLHASADPIDFVHWSVGVAALGAVAVQGILGGITMLFLLPASISAAHATLAQVFFAPSSQSRFSPAPGGSMSEQSL